MSSRGKKKKSQKRQWLVPALSELYKIHIQREEELAERISDKTTIYLDTNHWVHMKSVVLGRQSAKPEYREILELLEELVADGIAICPVSSHMFEELMLQTDSMTRTQTARLMDRLSQKLCLQFILKLATREWLHNVWHIVNDSPPKTTFPIWTTAGFWAGQVGALKDADIWSESSLSHIVAWFEMMWDIGFEGYQELPGYEETPRSLNEKFLTSMNTPEAREKASGCTFEQLTREEKRKLLSSLKTEFLSEPLPKTNVVPDRIFTTFVDDHDPRIIPPFHILACLIAAVLKSNRKITKSDPMDFCHAASGIPYCDAYLCDRKMALFLNGKPLEFSKIYNTRILSGADDIIDYLKSIRQ